MVMCMHDRYSGLPSALAVTSGSSWYALILRSMVDLL